MIDARRGYPLDALVYVEDGEPPKQVSVLAFVPTLNGYSVEAVCVDDAGTLELHPIVKVQVIRGYAPARSDDGG